MKTCLFFLSLILKFKIARCDPGTVNDKIFPHLADGFEDKSPVLREMTVKAVLTLAPKLKVFLVFILIIIFIFFLKGSNDRV